MTGPGVSVAMRRITLDVKPYCEDQALQLARHFAQIYPDHFRDKNARRYGVIYQTKNNNTYYVYGNAEHIRVKQSPD